MPGITRPAGATSAIAAPTAGDRALVRNTCKFFIIIRSVTHHFHSFHIENAAAFATALDDFLLLYAQLHFITRQILYFPFQNSMLLFSLKYD